VAKNFPREGVIFSLVQAQRFPFKVMEGGSFFFTRTIPPLRLAARSRASLFLQASPASGTMFRLFYYAGTGRRFSSFPIPIALLRNNESSFGGFF